MAKGYKKTGKIKARRNAVLAAYGEIDFLLTDREKIIEICKRFPEAYPQILRSKRYRHLFDLIVKSTPLLSDKRYTLATRIHWFLNGWTDFPRCLNEKCNHKKLIGKNIDVLFGHYPRFCNQTCINQSEYHKELLEKSSQQHFGTDHPMQCKRIQTKASKTLLKKTGYDNPMKDPKTVAKNRKTYKKRTGYDHLFKNPEFKKQRVKTWKKKYGVDNPNKDKSVRQKIERKIYKKFGVRCIFQSNTCPKFTRKTYCYDNLIFASFPEFCYYLWLKKNNIRFKFQPKVNFHFQFGGKCHRYTPDFYLIKEKTYVDIKGLHFFEDYDPTKKMINPYDRSKDALYEAKHSCMLRNKVRIVTNYQKYVEFAIKIFGLEYLESFLVKKTKRS